jgi:organic hydroperoxide reductase OsmC/OhrA
LAVGLRASLPGIDRARAEELVALAHEEICPCSRALRGKVVARVGAE